MSIQRLAGLGLLVVVSLARLAGADAHAKSPAQWARSASQPAVLFAASVDPQKFLYYCRLLGARAVNSRR